MAVRNCKKKMRPTLSRLADSDTTKKFEDEPAERKRLTALQTWEMEDFIFDLQSKEEVRRGGGGKKGEITASPRAVSEALACAYVGLLG